ncbi:hypothetical protein GGI06_005739, partial [Coemansia sp. S85]
IRLGPLRCLFTSPVSRGLHSTSILGEGKKTDRANATKGQRTAAATEGDSGAKATEVPVDEADEAVIQQGSLLTAEAIDTPDTSDEKPMKGGKVTSRGYLGW